MLVWAHLYDREASFSWWRIFNIQIANQFVFFFQSFGLGIVGELQGAVNDKNLQMQAKWKY